MRFTIRKKMLRKKVEGPKKKKVMEGLWGVLSVSPFLWDVVGIQGCGGGEVSGGGTHYM
jgi:hypothetical protein